MKTAIERQAERDKAARMRIAAEDRERELSAFIVPDSKPNWVRAERDEQRNNPDRMPCCGAPKDGTEASKKYSRRHYKGIDMVRITEPCVPARQCSNRYDNKETDGAVRQKERGPDRMPCCGAPRAGDEATDRFYLRHRHGAFGLDAGKPCLAAARCRTAYNRIIGRNRKLREQAAR